jgi:hypothetical protein
MDTYYKSNSMDTNYKSNSELFQVKGGLLNAVLESYLDNLVRGPITMGEGASYIWLSHQHDEPVFNILDPIVLLIHGDFSDVY